MNYLAFNDQDCEETLNGIDIAYSGGGYESGGDSSVGGLSFGGMSDIYSEHETEDGVSIGGMSSVASEYNDELSEHSYYEQEGGDRTSYLEKTNYVRIIRDILSINVILHAIFNRTYEKDNKKTKYYCQFSTGVNSNYPSIKFPGIKKISEYVVKPTTTRHDHTMKEHFNEYIKMQTNNNVTVIKNDSRHTYEIIDENKMDSDIKKILYELSFPEPRKGIISEKLKEHKYEEIVKVLYQICIFMRSNLRHPVTKNPALFHYYYKAISNAFDVLVSLENIFFNEDTNLEGERKLHYITIVNELFVYYLYVKSKSPIRNVENSDHFKMTENFTSKYMDIIKLEQIYTSQYDSFRSFTDKIVEIAKKSIDEMKKEDIEKMKKEDIEKNKDGVLKGNEKSLESLARRKMGHTFSSSYNFDRKKDEENYKNEYELRLSMFYMLRQSDRMNKQIATKEIKREEKTEKKDNRENVARNLIMTEFRGDTSSAREHNQSVHLNEFDIQLDKAKARHFKASLLGERNDVEKALSVMHANVPRGSKEYIPLGNILNKYRKFKKDNKGKEEPRVELQEDLIVK